MKKYLFFVVMSLVATSCWSQWQPSGQKIRYVYGIGLSAVDMVNGYKGPGDTVLLGYNRGDSSIYLKRLKAWTKINDASLLSVTHIGNITDTLVRFQAKQYPQIQLDSRPDTIAVGAVSVNNRSPLSGKYFKNAESAYNATFTLPNGSPVQAGSIGFFLADTIALGSSFAVIHTNGSRLGSSFQSVFPYDWCSDTDSGVYIFKPNKDQVMPGFRNFFIDGRLKINKDSTLTSGITSVLPLMIDTVTNKVVKTSLPVMSAVGTANQVSVSAPTSGGVVTFALPSSIVVSGSLNAGTSVTAVENANVAGGVAFYGKRITDVSPLGNLLQLQNSAGTVNLATIDVNGNAIMNSLSSVNGLSLGVLSNGAGTDSLLSINNTVVRKVAAGGAGISGLTTNFITKASSATTITNSQVFDNGVVVQINGTIGGSTTGFGKIQVSSDNTGSGRAIVAGSYSANAGSVFEGNDFTSATVTSRISAAGTIALSGGMSMAYVEKTSAYTASLNDYVINCTSGTFNLSLPGASAIGAGKIFIVKNTGGGSITLLPNGADTIDGAASVVLSTVNSGRVVMSKGTNGYIVIGSF